MLSIKKLVSLKKRSQFMLSHIPIDDPLDIVSREYVSETGLTKSDIIDKIDKIKSCCSVVELQASYNTIDEHTSEQVLQVSNANFCKQHAVCPVCADRSQNRRRARYNEPIKEQASRVREGQRYAYIVTYTVTDGNSLSERLRHLKQSRLAWRKMGQKRKNKRSNGEAAKIKAGLSTIEIKRGRDSGQWHVHARGNKSPRIYISEHLFHVMLMFSLALLQKWLRRT